MPARLVLFRWDAPLLFANAEGKDPVKDWLKRYGLLDRLGPERFHPTVGTAVDAYVAETGVEWRESDEELGPQPGRWRRATTRPMYG